MRWFSYFCIQIVLTFFVSQYKGLLELLPEPTRETFSVCIIALDNLQEVFGCSIVTHFMSTMFGISKVFGC